MVNGAILLFDAGRKYEPNTLQRRLDRCVRLQCQRRIVAMMFKPTDKRQPVNGG